MTTIPGGPAGQFVEFFRRHWSRGAPGLDTPNWVLLLAYRVWVLALLFKLLGSSWDMSWHFKYLRDDLAPPHLVNTVGTVTVVVLVMIHTYTGMGASKRALRLMQAGTAIFLVAAPLDVLNHRINGLDLTAWSPSHALLYLGTAIMILGVIDGWIGQARPGREKTALLGVLWILFLENVLFSNGQQEYGVLELRSWDRGEPYAEPSLLRFAAEQMGRPVDREAVIGFALPIHDWVYPVWGVVAGGLVLVAARHTLARAWAATAVAGAYVAYRALIWPLLVAADFPPSTVPFWMVFVGLAIDLAHRRGLPRTATVLLGATLATVFGYAALYLQDRLIAAPPSAYWSAPIALALLAALWWSAKPLARLANRPSTVDTASQP
ncbi:hypothetical protein EV193_105469 [Herbihabitans rhizosphaerae]|uniref:Uncharacterized protein n=1 Tax=Herbihabitans rhizosphaerae TaxID=1872711 RepID=A0A4Q7KMK0_9PSEU|nr:hypothetical protein [Herbihabitans rhizosphaerae]RZS37909.1 hypothetical protein EV193_105469 [Herbihabitans rhizosphaerae]